MPASPPMRMRRPRPPIAAASSSRRITRSPPRPKSDNTGRRRCSEIPSWCATAMTYCRRSSAHGTVDPIVFAAPCCRNDRRKTVCYHLPTATASARRDGHGVSERERADQMVTSPPVETAIAAATWQAVARTRLTAQVGARAPLHSRYRRTPLLGARGAAALLSRSHRRLHAAAAGAPRRAHAPPWRNLAKDCVARSPRWSSPSARCW